MRKFYRTKRGASSVSFRDITQTFSGNYLDFDKANDFITFLGSDLFNSIDETLKLNCKIFKILEAGQTKFNVLQTLTFPESLSRFFFPFQCSVKVIALVTLYQEFSSTKLEVFLPISIKTSDPYSQAL